MLHWHSCPECYEKWTCTLDCTIEPDLDDPICHPGKQFAAHCICDECEGQAKDSRGVVIFSPEWWARYHGFIK
jgi:hypothetical protein